MNSTTLTMAKLTRADLLQAPIWLAERLVICYLDAQANQRSIEAVQTASERIRAVYWPKTGETDHLPTNAISSVIHQGLYQFYRKVPLLVPNSSLEQIRHQFLLFPNNTRIDWDRLTDYFLGVSEAIYETVGKALSVDLISDYIKLQFVLTSQQLARMDLPYDDQLARQGLEKVMILVCQDTKQELGVYWQQYSRLPLQIALLKIKAITATLRFTAYNAETIGSPADTSEWLNHIFSEEIYVKAVSKWLRYHELKEEELTAHLALQTHLDTSSSRLALPSDKCPRIIVDPSKIESLFAAIHPFMSKEDGIVLRTLLSGEEAAGTVTVVGRPGNSIAYVLLQAHDEAYIANDKAEVMRWLIRWFQVSYNNKIRPLTEAALIDVFYKKVKPSKSNRIPYKP